jgi:hypothetical protein
MTMPSARLALMLVLVLSVGLIGCEEEELPFPDQIGDIVKSLGEFHKAILDRDEPRLAAVCEDPELYGELVYVLGDDSLAVASRRITNPIDSGHITMMVSSVDRATATSNGLYELELFMKKRGAIYWIVAHKLTPYQP